VENLSTFDLVIQPLGRLHDRVAFSCGKDALDRYFRTQASQDVKKRVAATFVLVDPGNERRVLGFYTLSATSIRLSDLPTQIVKRLPKYPIVPATLLGRLAVSIEVKGQHLGEFLLMDALHRSLSQCDQIGSLAVVVDAKDDQACLFYRRYDFIQFSDEPSKFFLPMGSIEKLF
jgi:predicted GNAT family N-acyltransferase